MMVTFYSLYIFCWFKEQCTLDVYFTATQQKHIPSQLLCCMFFVYVLFATPVFFFSLSLCVFSLSGTGCTIPVRYSVASLQWNEQSNEWKNEWERKQSHPCTLTWTWLNITVRLNSSVAFAFQFQKYLLVHQLFKSMAKMAIMFSQQCQMHIMC